MVLKINGVDITPYIANQGVKWQRSDIDASNSGRSLDGNLIRSRVAKKFRLDITCRPLTAAEANIVLNLIEPVWVSVTYTDPMNGEVTRTMYSNNIPATFLIRYPNGVEYWSGITFPLIQK